MNKKGFIEKLKEKTNRTEEECVIINDILENHNIVGRNNKDKIKSDFMVSLKISEEEADELYNICSETIVKGIFRKD